MGLEQWVSYLTTTQPHGQLLLYSGRGLSNQLSLYYAVG